MQQPEAYIGGAAELFDEQGKLKSAETQKVLRQYLSAFEQWVATLLTEPSGRSLDQRITPCLWFDGNAEEAARFYAGVFPDSTVNAVHRAPGDYPAGKTGNVLIVEFTLQGQPFTGLNGGPQFRFNEAISFQIPVDTQEQADRYLEALSAVPEAEQCGWLKDRFGVSWQIVPRLLMRLFSDPDPARAKRAFEAMMQMKRIDIAGIERAANCATDR
jgi:predicted 3-demethylubiquinone-9 3-methyltransferase (glyoxalase superfamily)